MRGSATLGVSIAEQVSDESRAGVGRGRKDKDRKKERESERVGGREAEMNGPGGRVFALDTLHPDVPVQFSSRNRVDRPGGGSVVSRLVSTNVLRSPPISLSLPSFSTCFVWSEPSPCRASSSGSVTSSSAARISTSS